jgi:hypothetical protein
MVFFVSTLIFLAQTKGPRKNKINKIKFESNLCKKF